MSLQKTIKTNYGSDATYHKIIRIHSDWQNKTAVICVGAFVNEAAKINNSRELELFSYSATNSISEDTSPVIKFDDLLGSNGEISRAKCYISLLTLNEWKDAISV